MFAMLTSMLLAAVALAAPQGNVPADAKTTIATANAEWLQAMKSRDANTIAAPYSDDGVFVGPTGAVVKGRDGVAQLMRDRFAQIGKVTSGELVQDGVIQQGKLIYEWGHAVLSVTSEAGKATQSRGRYLTVWQKNAAGRWQIIRNLSLPD